MQIPRYFTITEVAKLVFISKHIDEKPLYNSCGVRAVENQLFQHCDVGKITPLGVRVYICEWEYVDSCDSDDMSRVANNLHFHGCVSIGVGTSSPQQYEYPDKQAM